MRRLGLVTLMCIALGLTGGCFSRPTEPNKAKDNGVKARLQSNEPEKDAGKKKATKAPKAGAPTPKGE